MLLYVKRSVHLDMDAPYTLFKPYQPPLSVGMNKQGLTSLYRASLAIIAPSHQLDPAQVHPIDRLVKTRGVLLTLTFNVP